MYSVQSVNSTDISWNDPIRIKWQSHHCSQLSFEQPQWCKKGARLEEKVT